jgi:uncharacterized phage-associated protein
LRGPKSLPTDFPFFEFVAWKRQGVALLSVYHCAFGQLRLTALMAYDARTIANHFLSLAEIEGKPIDPMKLQKLVYYAHGWHLAIKDEPLIDEQVEAWPYGPVIPSLYRELKIYEDRPITSKIEDLDVIEVIEDDDVYYRDNIPSIEEHQGDAEFTKSLLQKIWNVYGKYSAIQLSNMTHEENSPWHQIHTQYGGRVPKGTDIPSEIIRDYFLKSARSRATTR